MENKIEEYAGFIISFCIFTFLVGITFWVSKQFYPQDHHSSIMNCVILFWTMVAVIWYAWETEILRKSTQKQAEGIQIQNEIQQRPFVIIQDIDINKIRLRNIGTSPAFNIKVWGARIDFISGMIQDQNLTWESLCSYGSISYMGHTFVEPTDIEVRIFNAGFTGKGIEEVDLRLSRYFLVFKIMYDNVNIQTYYTEQGIKPIIQTSIDLKIFSSGKMSNRTDEDLIWVSTSKDGMTNEVYLTQTGKRRLREITT